MIVFHSFPGSFHISGSAEDRRGKAELHTPFELRQENTEVGLMLLHFHLTCALSQAEFCMLVHHCSQDQLLKLSRCSIFSLCVHLQTQWRSDINYNFQEDTAIKILQLIYYQWHSRWVPGEGEGIKTPATATYGLHKSRKMLSIIQYY